MITYELVGQAIALATPSIEAILATDEALWGPRYVEIVIKCPNGPYAYIVGNVTPWQEEWGEEVDFGDLAWGKANLSYRTGLPNSVVINQHPSLLRAGDPLDAGGVAEPLSLAVGVSGAKEEADEGIAWLVFNIIYMLVSLKITRVKKGSLGGVGSGG
ncbi:MAG: hypothetical protein Q7S03_04160 [bacterium]|nr:hypothetical protein [bacterium]